MEDWSCWHSDRLKKLYRCPDSLGLYQSRDGSASLSACEKEPGVNSVGSVNQRFRELLRYCSGRRLNAKPKRQRKAPAEPKEKKVSALEAAARVLAEEARPMTCKEMIETMAAKGYWTSPGGKTPDATLYSAMLREIDTKGSEARFIKTERSKFSQKV
jgi:hypothetical protein